MKYTSYLLSLVLLIVCLTASLVEATPSIKSSLKTTASSPSSTSNTNTLALKPSFIQKMSEKATKVVAQAGARQQGSLTQLAIGAGGIYFFFMYYGLLQEHVMGFVGKDGSKFSQTWFIQVVEALANVMVGYLGRMAAGGGTAGIPLTYFGLGGIAQVSAKAFTMSALGNGVSFPVVTLAKSGKMVPVMVGSILLGGAKYTLKQYLTVLAIIAGTVIVSSGKKKSGEDSLMGLLFIFASLTCDGLAAGMQSKHKNEEKKVGKKATSWDNMMWTNLFMALTALVISGITGDLMNGLKFCDSNREIVGMIAKFCACSACGQAFIFYLLANFDPLVCTTVTTTRKVFSVLLSIFLNGHTLNPTQWGGLGLASAGIMTELHEKASHGKVKDEKDKKK